MSYFVLDIQSARTNMKFLLRSAVLAVKIVASHRIDIQSISFLFWGGGDVLVATC